MSDSELFDGTAFDPQFLVALKLLITSRISNQPVPVIRSGTAIVPAGNSFAVVHGLGGTPNLVTVSGPLGTGGQVYVSQNTGANGTHIYFDNSASTSIMVTWYAAIIQ